MAGILPWSQWVNSSPLSGWTRSALIQVMACHEFSILPSPETMLTYCHLDPWEQTSVKFESKRKTFRSGKCIWKCRLWNGGHFVQGEMSWIGPCGIPGCLPPADAEICAICPHLQQKNKHSTIGKRHANLNTWRSESQRPPLLTN